MGQLRDVKKVRLRHLAQAKHDADKIVMLTAYDQPTAAIFDAAGTDLLLVGDSMGNAVLGYGDTLPVTLDDCIRATRAVAAGATRAMVISDLPFGSYEASAEQCFKSAAQLMKAGAQGVKLEGGTAMTAQIRLLSQAGIPVMGHLGFTPQSVNVLSGNRIQGRDQASADHLKQESLQIQRSGAFALVIEMVPAGLAAALTDSLDIPVIGIGAGPDTDGQVLVWTDMAGLTEWTPSFVRRFGQIGQALRTAAADFGSAVRDGTYPDDEHSFQ
ncbi:MAG: 3-methyl-2-oxobutanoate hydroxymethyltransferase [Bifidobacteriaceae bacterium]|jgi:3-methyl-2-oxobutanoate hydroxymethyltransferase|nr:3-methyl-2-oxobutanoate hydroxymethyltransferase [Bifidobacteriaceae bacterium]